MATGNKRGADPVLDWLNRGVALQQAGDLAGALALYAKVPPRHPAVADALHLSGIARSHQGDPSLGARLIRQAIALSPNAPIYHVNLANALESLGDLPAAEQSLRQAIAIDGRFTPALFNLGHLLSKTGRLDEAVAWLDRTLVAEPTHLKAWLVLGGILRRKKLGAMAYRAALKARELAPDNDDASDLYIGALLDTKRDAEVVAEVDRRLARSPRNFELLRAKAHALYQLGYYLAAVTTYRSALTVEPLHRDATLELAATIIATGDYGEACDLLIDQLENRTRDAITCSDLVFALNYADDFPRERLLELHKSWESMVPLKRPPFRHGPLPDRPRIRIAYVSEDFKQHSVSWFIENVLAGHNRNRFEVFAYFLNPDPDAVTARIRAKVDCFRDTDTKAWDEVAAQIHADGIDIAIELSGHTSHRVLETLLYRPAPIQVDWLGYPNTTGVSAIDYRISDAVADPPGPGDEWNTEKVVRLPDCFHCYRPEIRPGFDPEPPVARKGFVTFGSFNVLPKLSPACVAAWARIVGGVPGARLLLKNRALRDPGVRETTLARFEAAGLPADRITIMGDIAGWEGHMACYRDVDIALDPFPYNGTTTTCEALWMGVPVITAHGDRHASRVGASLLTAISHPELVAPDRERYVEEAIRLAKDHGRIAALHRQLHDDLLSSPVCDLPRFVANLEAAYEGMLARYREGCEVHH